MPANPKYLSKSIAQRISKISAAVLGGYLVSSTFHMALALWLPDHKIVLITSVFTLFILWMALMIIPFLAKNGWKVWGIYLLVTLLFSVAVHYGQIIHPI